MLTKIIGFLRPPEYENNELSQKAIFLHTTLFVLTGACLLLGILNTAGKTDLDTYLFSMAGISLLCIFLNKRGYFTPVAAFMTTLLLGLITYSLIDGVGLKDAGLIAYPSFILFASFLFNKKASFFTTILSIGSVLLIYYLNKIGYLEPAKYSDESQLKVICILFVAIGLFLWAIMDSWERILRDQKETYDLTLIGWGKALEFRDQETEGHSQRVVDMTIELAKRSGISGAKLEHIRRGALLHDIGKMAIPDSILLKKDRLSESEWKVVKMHPLHAKTLLENIPFLKPALEIPYSHHERWDGSGYPQGLSKEDIPYAARIFAVVDVWDALTSERPYRQAWSKERVRNYIEDQSGILFDPQVVKVFLKDIEGSSSGGDKVQLPMNGLEKTT